MPVTKSTFGEYELYTIKNSSGAYVRIASLGAAVQSIVVPNRNGAPTDVVLGYDTPGSTCAMTATSAHSSADTQIE